MKSLGGVRAMSILVIVKEAVIVGRSLYQIHVDCQSTPMVLGLSYRWNLQGDSNVVYFIK